MTTATAAPTSSLSDSSWLRQYYFVRGAFSLAWVGLAFTIGRSMPAVAAALLVAYPAWDALANVVDAQRSGGLSRNRSQAGNAVASTLVAIAVAIALGRSMNAVLAVFGVWATLAGLFQLATGVRRWKTAGAQWAMILSGGQSALAGLAFMKRASGPATPDIASIAPYAAFGAFYFLVSAISLAIAAHRARGSAQLHDAPAASR